ncbi:hypothetical protein TNIN_113501 [Trichonephila inaurata madagascariensis]|uniref:Uncharacterized protein n=1 Tax=Trichonephila inaurata madagascariensis TaxID=2747483 RepID=A0A8X6XHI5_9ARAC|nr:hypothetical protein TNIN_113501 [Trichonephila inaurata madagascariensis]
MVQDMNEVMDMELANFPDSPVSPLALSAYLRATQKFNRVQLSKMKNLRTGAKQTCVEIPSETCLTTTLKPFYVRALSTTGKSGRPH